MPTFAVALPSIGISAKSDLCSNQATEPGNRPVPGGAIAFSRSGDMEFGDFDEPVILGRFGDVPREFQ